MTKNKIGGKNFKKGKANVAPRQLELAEQSDKNMQDYAQVLEKLGGPRMRVKLQGNGQEVMGLLCGRMRKRQWINKGDWVLVSIREFQSDKCDIIHSYNAEDVRKLRKLGQLKESSVAASTTTQAHQQQGFDNYFAYEQEQEEENESVGSKPKQTYALEMPSSDDEEYDCSYEFDTL